MCNIKIPHKNKLLSIFHINVCSLNKSFDDLQHLSSCTKFFDIIAISEPRVISHSSTFIDNTLSNITDPDMILGNLTATIFGLIP